MSKQQRIKHGLKVLIPGKPVGVREQYSNTLPSERTGNGREKGPPLLLLLQSRRAHVVSATVLLLKRGMKQSSASGECQLWYHHGCASIPSSLLQELADNEVPFLDMICSPEAPGTGP